MKYIFRGNIVFEYVLERKVVIQHWKHDKIPMFNYCSMIPEDYKLLSMFFDTVYRHIQGEAIELKDIVVN
jgi:hypothetical protein